MKKLQNIGKSLSKQEQKEINGGSISACTDAAKLSCEADGDNWISIGSRPRPCDGYCDCLLDGEPFY